MAITIARLKKKKRKKRTKKIFKTLKKIRSLIVDICAIAGFLLAVYIFIKEHL